MTDSAPGNLPAEPFPRKGTVAPIVLVVGFLIFTALLLLIGLVNSFIEARSAQTLSAINLAGRQSALVERMAKDLVEMRAAIAVNQSPQVEQGELFEATTLFDLTQRAFGSGGQTRYLSGLAITVDRLEVPSEQRLLDRSNQIWVLLHARIARALHDVRDAPALDAAVRTSLIVSPQMASLMDELSVDMSRNASVGTAGWANARNILVGLAVLTFLIVVFILFARVSAAQKQLGVFADSLVKRNAEVEEGARQLADAKASADLIMDTVTQGLFLIDTKYKINGQYSRELEQIFRLPELAGYNLLNILQRLLTERMFNTSRDYLALLFDKGKKERTVLKVNPLAEIEVNFADPEGGFLSKYLSFSFRRLMEHGENGQITRVFVAVSDITERVQLERQLRESEQRKDRQFEFLLGVVHVEPAQLDDFLKTAREQIAVMNDTLRAQDFALAGMGQMELLRQRLDVVYRSVHNVKGNAAMLKLQHFQKVCEQFEDKIMDLKNRSALGGDDFLSVVIAQSELRQDLDELQELRDKFAGIGRMNSVMSGFAPSGQAPEGGADDLISAITSLAVQIGRRQSKEVRVDAAGFSTGELPDDKRRIVKDVLIQLARNSMTHGIEESRLREALGKARMGTITIRALPGIPAHGFGFSFRDDGRGLDPTRIRERAVERGILSPSAAATLSDGEIVGLIFQPGFSTAEEMTLDSGRGVGMSVVKEAIVDKCGGEIDLNSEPGVFTEFSFILPASPPMITLPATPEFARN
jgi:two-component system, chemotaxis family, sensor kinase CheA